MWMISLIYHAEFGKYIAEYSVQITQNIDTEDVIKSFYDQIMKFTGKQTRLVITYVLFSYSCHWCFVIFPSFTNT
jgi:hypothetical protein